MASQRGGSDNEEEQVYLGVEGYQFEPENSDSGSLSSSEDSSGSEEELAVAVGRVGNTNWCQCHCCEFETLSRVKEHRCCREYPTMKADMQQQDISCITAHESFSVLCLHRDVLINVLVALNNIRRDNWQVAPPSNRSLRWAAYRQFTWWAHGYLGYCVRRVIPACAIHTIRKAFPAEAGDNYEPYASNSEDSE